MSTRDIITKALGEGPTTAESLASAAGVTSTTARRTLRALAEEHVAVALGRTTDGHTWWVRRDVWTPYAVEAAPEPESGPGWTQLRLPGHVSAESSREPSERWVDQPLPFDGPRPA